MKKLEEYYPATFPVDEKEEKGKKKSKNETIICLPYDLPQIYPFFRARYHIGSYNELLQMGAEDFGMCMGSIPEDEPIYNTIKSRVINIGKIKDKHERRYWEEQKRLNRIPDQYLAKKEIDSKIKKKIKIILKEAL